MTPPTLDELPACALKLPPLPEVVNYLTRSLSDEHADIDRLSHHINSDPAIVARLLAAANSAAFGLSTRIFTTKQAFLVLGVDRIVNIILASALAYRYDIRHSGFDARLLWRHSLGVATCAKVLAGHTGIDAHTAFTSGLLHDIGQLLMYVAHPACYLQVIEHRRQEDISLQDAERHIFGYDHTEAGKALAIAWRLPAETADAIAAHHNPDEIGSEIGNLIHVSEVLSHALDLGEQPNNHVPDVSELACAQLGLNWSSLKKRFAEIEACYEGFLIALGM